MGETMKRWPASAAALAALLALSACSRALPPQAQTTAAPVAEESAPPLAGAPTAQAPALAETAPTAEPVSYASGYGRTYRGAYAYRAESYADRERRLAYEQYREDQRHAAREHYLARQRYLAHEHWLRSRHAHAGRWAYREHHLVYERPHRHAAPRPAQPVSHATTPAPAPHPVAKPAPAPAKLVRPHRIVVKPEAKPVVLHPAPIKPLDHSLALPLITTQAATATPAITPDQAAAAPAVDLGTQLGELTTAAAQDMKDARLDLPAALSTGGEGKVVLTLPASLLATIQVKAKAVGLGASGRKVFITARLAGQGYAITPNQGQTTRVDAGPTIFAWDVKPSGAPGGVLTADMTGSLQGEDQAKTFALGAVTAQIPAPGQAAPAAAPAQATAPAQVKLPSLGHLNLKLPDLLHFRLRDLAIPGHPTVAVPGLGPTPSEKVVAAGLVALILILLISIMRNASARRERAQRRQRFHSFEATQFGDEHH